MNNSFKLSKKAQSDLLGHAELCAKKVINLLRETTSNCNEMICDFNGPIDSLERHFKAVIKFIVEQVGRSNE